MLQGAGTWREGGLVAFLPTCLLGLLSLLVLLSGLDRAVALPTRFPPTEVPYVRDGEPVARTEAYVHGDQGRTWPPETQVITQQVLEAMGEPLEQTLPQVTRGYVAAAEAGDAVAGEGLPVVGQNGTEAWAPDGAGPPGKDTEDGSRNTSAARKNDNQQDIVEMEESMEKIKSALKQLEVDIARKRKTDDGKELSPTTEPLTNLTAVRAHHQERPSAKLWHKGGGPAGMSSDSHQMLPAIKPGSGDYSQNISDKQINTSEEIDEAGPDGTNSSSSEDELLGTEATTQTVWKWNIQNGTNYTEPLADLGVGVPLGKVCILLNGTVVKDMEESDCKSQAGLHYKYVPSRLRKNGTNLNSTAAYGAYPEGSDIEEEDGFVPQEQGANWEDAQWELYNGNLERNATLEEDSSLDNNNTEGKQVLGMNPLLSGKLLNISETLPNPFESPVNGTGPFDTPLGILHAGQEPNVVPGPEGGRMPLREGFPMEPLLTENHTNQTNNTETMSQVFWAENKGSVQLNNSSRSENASSSRNQTPSPQQPMGTQLHGVGNYSQPPQGILSDVHINGSQPQKDGRNSSPWELVKEEGVGGTTRGNSSGLPISPPTGGQRTENVSAIKGTGKELADNKPDQIEPNPKFMREPTVTTRKPHSVHVFRNRYPPHAIQGLIWEDRRYMVSVLVPVACGMAGAFLIVCLAYLSRHCRYQQPKLKQLPNVPKKQLTQFDRVMLLADSSDEDF